MRTGTLTNNNTSAYTTLPDCLQMRPDARNGFYDKLSEVPTSGNEIGYVVSVSEIINAGLYVWSKTASDTTPTWKKLALLAVPMASQTTAGISKIWSTNDELFIETE